MNTHFQQGWQYSDAARSVSALKDLGVSQVRDAFTGLGHAGMEYAARNGIRFDFIIGAGPIEPIIDALEEWELRYPGSILAIEGPNEVNNWPVTYQGRTGILAAMAFQRDLYKGVHASPVLAAIPVVALTSWPVFPNKSDIGNVHAYARTGGYATPDIRSAVRYETLLNPPARRIWLTEVGYHTRLGDDHDEGVSEAAQAKMLVATLLSAFAEGIEKVFVYQLLNQYTDLGDEQAYFGVIDQQWRTKPAFTAIGDMLRILRQVNGDGGRFRGEALDYRLDGLPPTGRQALLQADGGDWLLAVWDEAGLWNDRTNSEITHPPKSVNLVLGTPHRSISVYDPLVATAPVRVDHDTDKVSLDLADHPLLIRIERPPGLETATCGPPAAGDGGSHD